MEFDTERLLTLLEEHHMTVQDLADKIQVSRQLIYRWLQGKSIPGMKNQVKLCKLFGVDLNFFYPSMRKERLEAVAT